MKTLFKITVKEVKIRKVWSHEVNPVQRAFKSKRDYNRHDKSWKNEE